MTTHKPEFLRSEARYRLTEKIKLQWVLYILPKFGELWPTKC